MKYGLIGKKLGHSYSKIIHEKLGNPDYILKEIPENEIALFFKNRDFCAINVTIPYKKTAYAACDELSDTARAIGSVNAVVKRVDGTLYGDNTDAYGFEFMMDSVGIDPADKKCIVLGSGGSSVMAQYVLKKRGASSVTVISRSSEDNYENIAKHNDAEVIVNTTPVGMYPENGVSAIDLSMFDNCIGVVDLIYNPMRTKLIFDAMEHGIPCVSGLVMLVAQAKRAHELFFDKPCDIDIMELTENIASGMKNILLVGMPGSGKSTIARLLAKKTGRELIDTDDEIVKREERSIPDIFAKDGEKAFRAIETEVLADITKKSGCIIACGGGVVTVPENMRLIRQNSTVFRIDRPLEELATKGRPLSGEKGVLALFEARDALYNAAADYTVKFTSSEDACTKILEILGVDA